jgi:hypothetical protein
MRAFWFGILLCVAVTPMANAQSSAMVQCRIGSWVKVVPDFACDAIRAGSLKLSPFGTDAVIGDGMRACALEVTKYVQARPDEMLDACQSVWLATKQDIANYEYHHPYSPCLIIHADGRREELSTSMSDCQRRIGLSERENKSH